MRGSVQKRGSKYSVVVELGKDDEGNRKQKRISGFKTKKEAEVELARVVTELERGLFADCPAKLTVSDYLDRWFETHKTSISYTTAERYAGVIENHLKPRLGKIILSKLTPLQIQEFIAIELKEGRKDNKKTAGKGLSAATVRYEYIVLHKALGQAVDWGLLSLNPADRAKPPRAEKKEAAFLNEDQVKLLLTELDKDSYLYIPTFLAI